MNLSGLRGSQVKRNACVRPPHFKAAIPVDHTPIWVTGGIGDLVCSIDALKDLKEEFGKIKIYTMWPEILREFGIESYHCAEFNMNCDHYIQMSGPVWFEFARNYSFKSNSFVASRYLIYRGLLSRYPELVKVVESHPHLDNIAAEIAVAHGIKRHQISQWFLGYPLRPSAKLPPQPHKRYITVHDGFDQNSKFSGRATKTWDLNHWNELVSMINNMWPGYEIIQLGGGKSRPIAGVKNLIGKTSIVETMKLLSNSLLHIDGDSGLVHLAWRYGVKSIVLFGPTNKDFFGYSENINIGPNECGNCWWLEKNWLQQCPATYDTPRCMDSIRPNHIFNCVQSFMGIQ